MKITIVDINGVTWFWKNDTLTIENCDEQILTNCTAEEAINYIRENTES